MAEMETPQMDLEKILRSIPEKDRFPCAFLDPAPLSWNFLTDERPMEDGIADIGPYRHHLSDLERSCDHYALKRAGRSLEYLKYVISKEVLAAYSVDSDYFCIPLALASPKYGGIFWRILPHIFAPGTMFEPRLAALLAALSIRVGIPFLRRIAVEELQKHTWNNLDDPEMWSTGYLALLLEVDESFKTRIRNGSVGCEINKVDILTGEERRLFKALVDYKMLEKNLNIPLTLQIAWHPEKTKYPLGPNITCKICHFPRSVTIMAKNGICGLCDKDACTCPSQKIHESQNRNNVTKGDGYYTKATWVECSLIDCRAQYVTYNPERPFKPRCHYCRVAGCRHGSKTQHGPTAPTIECSKCRSRIIWPEQYRSPKLNTKTYLCPACRYSSYNTIVEIRTTAKSLIRGNGYEWLLRDPSRKIPHPFDGRSIFSIVSAAAGVNDLADVVTLPNCSASPTYQGKQILYGSSSIPAVSRWRDAQSVLFSRKLAISVRYVGVQGAIKESARSAAIAGTS
ncbi:hypothetical protein MMC10_008934 [Thelotrema lepadinum]|nr:hypothetical protein [Thelotrema lepadinum]